MDSVTKYLPVGGLVAMGFDPSGSYLLVVSHSGRGVFSVESWTRVARDATTLYPSRGVIEGIGPLAGLEIAVHERDGVEEVIRLRSPRGDLELLGEEDSIAIKSVCR